MKKKGFTLIELLVVIAIIAMLLAILMPALNKVKKIAQRVVCGTNLKGLGTAQVVYSNDYDDAYAIQGGKGSHTWETFTSQWAVLDKDWSVEGNVTVGASLYLLVREADVSPKSFVCGAGGQTPYEGENPVNADITELWDFGRFNTTTPSSPDTGNSNIHGPKNHVSYSYQMPYGNPAPAGPGRFAADGTKSAAFAVMSDKNPWYDPKLDVETGPGTAESAPDNVRRLAAYWTSSSIQKFKIQMGNAYPHSREGQNVLFGDGHSSYEKTSDVGVKHDNIYTIAGTPDPATESPHRMGDTTYLMSSVYTIGNQFQPRAGSDSFLVNDDARLAPYPIP